MEKYYKDILIETLEKANNELTRLNEKQIEVNMEFAKVTKNNNIEFQKTFRWLISIFTAALVIICIAAIKISSDKSHSKTNDNSNIKNLINSNEMLNLKVMKSTETKGGQRNVRTILFTSIIESSDFIDFDVEVIVKNRDKAYFETLYIRKISIEILKKVRDYKVFCFSYKVNENYYINIYTEVINCILNNLLLDEYIEMFLKLDGYKYLISQFINLNILIKDKKKKGGNTMNKSMYVALKSAEKVADSIETNKLKSYRQKLTNAIIFKDYDRVCQILLQLSNYSGIGFDFAYDLFENFEENKDVIYTFINALEKNRAEIIKEERK